MLILPASAEVVASFLRLSAEAPEELSAIVNVMPAPPMPFVPEERHGETVVFALMAYAGPVDDGERVLAPFRALAEPIADLLRPIPYPEMYPSDDDSYHPTAVGRTMLLDRVDDGAFEAIVDRVAASDAPMRVVQLRALGGAMARVPADATAFAHRSSAIMATAASFYEGDDDLPARAAWVDDLAATIRDDADDRAYANFLGDEGPERVRAAYPGATWDRLREVKRRYDPTNLFRLNQNVPPAGG
jgi:FAD/FMN-containing dehydrogenase